MNTASASSHESKDHPTRTPHPSCDASVYVNNATGSDPLLGYAHDLIGRSDVLRHGDPSSHAGLHRVLPILGLRNCT